MKSAINVNLNVYLKNVSTLIGKNTHTHTQYIVNFKKKTLTSVGSQNGSSTIRKISFVGTI